MREPEQLVLDSSLEKIQTPENLREFLNNGAIYDLAYRLKLAAKSDTKPFLRAEPDGEFAVYWLHQTRKRILIVRNSISRLPGLFLKVPVELEEYKVAPGDIGASFTAIDEFGRRVPQPYSEGGLVIVGNPKAAAKVIIVAGQELSLGSGIVSAEDI